MVHFVHCCGLTIVSLLVGITHSNQDLFHGSTNAIDKVIQVEKAIFNSLQTYVSNLERKLFLSKRYLHDLEKSLEYSKPKTELLDTTQKNPTAKSMISRSEEIVENPLEFFRLLRRFSATLPELEKELHQDYERKFLRSLEKSRQGIALPQQSDLNSATEGLIRVQDAYDLDVFPFAGGQFNGLMTNSSLHAADCFLIGSYALTANIFTRAIQWLERAWHLVTNEFDDSISSTRVWDRLQKAVSQHNSALQSSHHPNPYLFKDKLDLETLRNLKRNRQMSRMLDRTSHKLYMTQPSLSDLTNFAKLCQGVQLQKPNTQRKLKCFLHQDSPRTAISPLQVELLHSRPVVMQIYNILPSSFSDDIVSQAKKTALSRSKVHGSKDEVHKRVSASRTSSTTWIHSPKITQRLRKIYAQLETLTGLDFSSPGACEDFQVSSYNSCGHYNPHLDSILTSEIAPAMQKEEIEKGDRMATLMFYLSDVGRGGRSAFPRLGISAQAIKGSALFWFNSKEDGEIDPLSLHGGCPIIFGVKWIANQWIRANSQMFSRKCSKVVEGKIKS